MLFPLLLIGGAGVGGYHLFKSRKMKASEKKIFDEAYANLLDVNKLHALADVFQKEGFPKEAKLLLQRAALREQPPEVQKARRSAFDKAMSSKDAAAVEKMAEEFNKIGALGASAALHKYAATLKAV